jgi:hypothetical protein
VCNRSAHCEGINGCQPHNLCTLLLLAAPTRSAHGRAGATGSVRHKRVWCNSDTGTASEISCAVLNEIAEKQKSSASVVDLTYAHMFQDHDITYGSRTVTSLAIASKFLVPVTNGL